VRTGDIAKTMEKEKRKKLPTEALPHGEF